MASKKTATKRKKRSSNILAMEISLFGIVLLAIWLDEFLDLPKILFGAPASPSRLAEFAVETGLIAIVGIVVFLITYLGMKRIKHLEDFLRICAWCKNVWFDDHWVKFEVYMRSRHELESTHSICEECEEKLMREIRS